MRLHREPDPKRFGHAQAAAQGRPVDREAARIRLPVRALTGHEVQAQSQIGIVFSDGKPHEIALAQDRGEQTGLRRQAVALRLYHHVGQPRMQRQAGHAATVIRGLPARIQHTKVLQERPRLQAGGLRRRVEPFETRGLRDAPEGELQHQPARSVCRISGRLRSASAAWPSALHKR